MTLRLKLPTNMVGATARFHRHYARRQSGAEFDDTLSTQPSPKYDLATLVKPNHTAAILSKINS
jgi:hypothetical protein